MCTLIEVFNHKSTPPTIPANHLNYNETLYLQILGINEKWCKLPDTNTHTHTT
jgi:hypothetical protein